MEFTVHNYFIINQLCLLKLTQAGNDLIQEWAKWKKISSFKLAVFYYTVLKRYLQKNRHLLQWAKNGRALQQRQHGRYLLNYHIAIHRVYCTIYYHPFQLESVLLLGLFNYECEHVTSQRCFSRLLCNRQTDRQSVERKNYVG